MARGNGAAPAVYVGGSGSVRPAYKGGGRRTAVAGSVRQRGALTGGGSSSNGSFVRGVAIGFAVPVCLLLLQLFVFQDDMCPDGGTAAAQPLTIVELPGARAAGKAAVVDGTTTMAELDSGGAVLAAGIADDAADASFAPDGDVDAPPLAEASESEREPTQEPEPEDVVAYTDDDDDASVEVIYEGVDPRVLSLMKPHNELAVAFDVRLLFVLVVYDEHTLAPLGELLRAVFHPYHFYCVHFDASVDRGRILAAVEQLGSAGGVPTNVFIEQKYYTTYGGFTNVLVLQNAFNSMLHVPGWQRVLWLTGDAYPVKTLRQLDSAMARWNATANVFGRGGADGDFYEPGNGNVLAHARVEELKNWDVLGWTKSVWVEADTLQYTPKPARTRFRTHLGIAGAQIRYAASEWMALTREFAEFAAVSYLSKDFTMYFSGTKHPIRTYFASMLAYAPPAEHTLHGGDVQLVYANYDDACRAQRGVKRVANRYKLDETQPYDDFHACETAGEAVLGALVADAHTFFVRKPAAAGARVLLDDLLLREARTARGAA